MMARYNASISAGTSMMSFCLCAFAPRVQDDPPLVPLAVGHHLPYTASAEVRHERRVSSVTRRYVVPSPPGVPLLGSTDADSQPAR